ncbi:MAG: transporter substrate-binding domain-containing protein [Kordiimonadaceae bacterium]|jgi:cyclohexadienyl dehydratase|nr:transporter substrate-binding domain-containing protein [Kordiimonadaceae bacterium]MBT6032001.1 transporter substrate-binding domain-containing protein [Kordiimonadaceae bacterium]
MKKRIFYIVISFLFFCSSGIAQTLELIKERNLLRIGTTGDYQPFSYMSGEDLKGIDITMAKNLATSLGVEVKFVNTSWPTLMDDLLANKYEIGMSGISITPERQKTASFSIPMLSDGKAAISRDEDAHKYTTIAAINNPNVRVIFNPGGTNEIFARENFPDAQLILNEDNITIFDKIIAGKADVMVTDAVETIIQQNIHPELEAVNPDKPFNKSEKAYLINKDPKFKAYIDQWLDMSLKDGSFKEIYDGELNMQ